MKKMKYKVGDEVLVNAKIIEVSSTGIFRVDSNGARYYLQENDIVAEMTAEEAWEIARRIILPECRGGLSSKEIRHIFGDVDVEDIIKDFSPQQAKAKIEEWEAEQIKVGDEVGHDGEIGVVTNTDDKAGFFNVLFKNGKTAAYKSERLKKTGRHIDIEIVLKQIGGTDA